jgi:hypothetical protein
LKAKVDAPHPDSIPITVTTGDFRVVLGIWGRRIKGPGSRAAGVAMAFKLIERPDESEGGDQQVA